MKFIPEKTPFPCWVGPYSPARGNNSGFRIRNGQLGAWIDSDAGGTFCVAHDTDGVLTLTKLVQNHWHGGRLLFLPDGTIVKPLQNEDETGLRVVGRYEGGFKIQTGDSVIDLSSRSHSPGTEWPGLSAIGLECTIKSDGTLYTGWKRLSDSNLALIAGFKKARPDDSGGRVRVTVCGHVVTNKKTRDGWKAFYVGKVEPSQFEKWDKWIQRRQV